MLRKLSSRNLLYDSSTRTHRQNSVQFFRDNSGIKYEMNLIFIISKLQEYACLLLQNRVGVVLSSHMILKRDAVPLADDSVVWIHSYSHSHLAKFGNLWNSNNQGF